MEQLHEHEPRVIFVTGGPGTGKGTQCPKLVEEFGYKHISTGDLIRAEMRSGSEEGKSMMSIVRAGGLVPKEITISLLQKALQSISAHTILVDGFPRSVDQAVYLEQIGVKVNYLLHFDTDQEDVLLNRLIERGKTSGRADDNEETIVKRFRIYKSESLPVLQLYEPFGIVRKVDCMGTINTVFQRTLIAIRPEVLFVCGPKNSGKTSLSGHLGSRYYYYVLDINRVIKKTHKNDEEITRKLVKTLQNFKHQHRILVDGFPQNSYQAKLFTGLIGLPNKVIYLDCPRDVCQERQLLIGKVSGTYIQSTTLSQLYSESIKTADELCSYYESSLKGHFGKIDSSTVLKVQLQASELVEPEVIIARGNLRPGFLLYYQSQGYKPINAVHLLELWRNARGLSVRDNQINLHDDPELIDILKDVVYSGNATYKFIIYNFALFDSGLIQEFQDKICRIKMVFQLYSSPEPVLDSVAAYFHPRKHFYMINSARISYKRSLLTEDIQKIEEDIASQSPPVSSSFILLIGATLTGKSQCSKSLIESGMRILDFASLIEDAKQRLSTEEDPKEDLTFTEMIEAVHFEAKKKPSQTIIIDGIPPNDFILAKDPLYPTLPIEENKEDEFPYDENPLIQEKVKIILSRMKVFCNSIQILSTVHFKVSNDVLEKRAKKKFETPDEEDLTNAQKSEIFESWTLAQSLYAKPVPSKTMIPTVITFATDKLPIPIISQKLKSIFKRKCVLLNYNYTPAYDIVQKIAWKNQIYFIDYAQISQEYAEDIKSTQTKLRILEEKCKCIPPRSRYVFLVNYPFYEDEYKSIVEELAFIEDYVGSLHTYLVFSDRENEIEVPEIIASKRKEEGHKAMWNDYKPVSQYKLFYKYKGYKSELETKVISHENYHQVYEDIERTIFNEKKTIYQFILDSDTARGFTSFINDQGTAICPEFKEKLFLDTSSLNLKQKLQAALRNLRARDFHSKHLKAYTVPFCLFFQAFTEHLKEENLSVTSGLRKSIRESIDSNKNSFIDADEVNGFFESWESPEEKEMIISRGASYDKKSKVSSLDYKLIVFIEESIPDPVTQCISFNRGDVFEIEYEGFPPSSRFCADRTVYFGKENSQFKNDIEFNSADTRISISHFQIHSKKNGYYIVDNSSDMGLKLKVFEIPVQLYEEAILYIGDHEIRVTACISSKNTEDNVIALDYKGKSQRTDNSTYLLQLEFISEALFGYKYSNEGKKIIKIGSSSSNDLVIHGASPFHALIELRPSGWCVSDNHTVSGTLISINSYHNIKYQKPSAPLKLLNGMRFVLPGLHFRVLYKNLNKLNLDLNDFREFRSEKFSDFYTLGRKMGKSLVGEKFLCTHIQSKQEYQVKIILIKDLTDQLRTEISSLRELDHPNITKVVDTLIDTSNLYVITEVCKGLDIFEQILNKGTNTEGQACNYIRELLQGISYLHSNNIVHRDVRPENLRFSDNNENSILKINDFANYVDSSILLEKITTTSHYLAPEALLGKYSKASDIWSCGIILYTLLVGVPPFNGKSDSEVRKKISKGTLGFKEKAWGRISNHAKRVVRLMLTFDQSKRPEASDLLLDPWIKHSLKSLDLSKPMIARTFKNFKSFYSSNKLQQGILHFMSQTLATDKIKKQASDLFATLDKNGDGKVSLEELKDGMSDNGIVLNDQELHLILSQIDNNDTGFIDFNEFMTAFINKNIEFTKENLESTFAIFDADGNGEITTSELKKILGQTESEWASTIKEIDENKDGKIDIKEFKNLLLNGQF